MQVRHTVTISEEENVHLFEVLGEDGEYKPKERVYGDEDAIRFLTSQDDGFGFGREQATQKIRGLIG